MYEVYDVKTGELVLVDLFTLEQGFENGTLSSKLEPKEPVKRSRKAKADENESD